MSWRTWAETEGAAIASAGLWRRVRDFDARDVVGTIDGRQIVSFASNDYLGLSHHPAVVAAAQAAAQTWGAGAGSARLIAGSRPIHARLENELAAWKQTERALLFASGFAANLGVLSALGAPDVLVVSDELNHASIIDACRLSRARIVVFPHRDVDAVEDALAHHDGRAIVVTDSVFSMDGDIAPLDALTEVCRRHGALLVVDEAHAVLDPELDVAGVECLRVGTLSKFLGAVGGFVAGPGPLIDLLTNRARPFIFTTAGSPADAGAALAALHIVRSEEGDRLRAKLRTLIDLLAPGHRSPIIPVVMGEEERVLAAAANLLDRGFLVPAIRPPSVPPGTARLRITLSAAHTEEQVDGLGRALAEVRGVRA
ncbi:MAG TPA: 8-amino-7-oxononanoate synthase [Actinomycetota bacterium]|nr:8-amino-7-oxononanoate synthase [Actinomycetota bacterium]